MNEFNLSTLISAAVVIFILGVMVGVAAIEVSESLSRRDERHSIEIQLLKKELEK